MEENIRNRNMGEIYTPSTVANLLFKTVQEVRPNFNKTDTVWDCCWGTGNLTKEFEFDNLFCSTLRAVDIRKNRNNNKNATKFSYNFLNADVKMLSSQHAMMSNESSLPEELETALRTNQPVMFYINPPYVTTYTSTNKKGSDSDIDERGSDTSSEVKQMMIDDYLGRCSDQLYLQFLYKILKIKQMYKNNNIRIALISPLMFLSGPSIKQFREVFLKEFHLANAYVFKANEFKGLSDCYGLGAMFWDCGEQEDKTRFEFKIVQDFNSLENLEVKLVYNIDDNVSLGQYLRERENKDMELAEYTSTSGVKITKENPNNVKKSKNSLGYFFFKANNNYHYKDCGIISNTYRSGSGVDITEQNADLCITAMSARVCNGRYGRGWIDDKDEYIKPNENHEEWRRLMLNCYMYAMFTGQTHLTSTIVDGKEFPNHFFHLSYDYMDKLFKKYGAEIKTPSKREDTITVTRLKELFAEPDLIYPYGVELWQAGLKMWDDTMERRLNGFADPMYQVENWDAGFYQIKQLTKDDTKMTYLKEFNKILKEYEVHIRKGVKEVGFFK